MAKQIELQEGAVALVFYHNDQRQLLSAVFHNFNDNATSEAEEEQTILSYLIRGIIEEVQEDVKYYVHSGISAVQGDMTPVLGDDEADDEEKPAPATDLKDMEPVGRA